MQRLSRDADGLTAFGPVRRSDPRRHGGFCRRQRAVPASSELAEGLRNHEVGAESEARLEETDSTPLHNAAMNGHVAAARLCSTRARIQTLRKTTDGRRSIGLKSWDTTPLPGCCGKQVVDFEELPGLRSLSDSLAQPANPNDQIGI